MGDRRLPSPRQRRPLQELIAPLFGYVVCDRPDGARGTEWVRRAEFRQCPACNDHYHQSWGDCPECWGI